MFTLSYDSIIVIVYIFLFSHLERFSPTKPKRLVKTLSGKKKEEFAETSLSEETPAVQEKPLQTTNQVKANLINANMIKGDMILTKPGQGRSKVTFVQKQVLMKPNELKNIGIKKPMMVSKGKFVNQPNTKIFTTKDGKLIHVPITSKTVSPSTQVSQMKTTPAQQPVATQQQPVQNINQGLPVQQQLKTAASVSNSTPPKIKSNDLKKEKRKLDGSTESLSKGEEVTPAKSADKALESQYQSIVI